MFSPIIRSTTFILVTALLLTACQDKNTVVDTSIATETSSDAPPSKAKPDMSSLKGKYAEHFLIGAAADNGSYLTHADLLKKHFSSFTTENEMKFESLQLEQGVFTFETADLMLDFARANGMATRGHALVWHRQTPSWVFFNDDGELRTKDELLENMRTHISTVVGHFKGKVDVWDVVNEAIMDDGAMRTATEPADDQKSYWYGIAGEEYIAEAFKAAHAADPNAKLYYNDYYNYIPARYEAIYNLVKKLKESGVPIHGVGIQAHVNIAPSSDPAHQSSKQTIENLEKAIQLYASLGLDVQITEMDLSVYIGGTVKSEADFVTPETFTPALQKQQAERYAAFFEMYRRNSDAISSVTFWGIADDNTWLSEFPSGRKDFPMLFDDNHQEKPAFEAVMDF